jgi:hypothetical protein
VYGYFCLYYLSPRVYLLDISPNFHTISVLIRILDEDNIS